MSSPSSEGSSLLAAVAKSIALFGAVAAGNAARRTGSMVAGYGLVAGLFGVSLCFLTVAGYQAISLALGNIYAALIVGSAFLIAGLMATVVVQARRR
jgi:hypothetical protein